MRIRTVKPEFFLHEELYELEKETSLPVRLAFIGLWCAADREGRFRWEPRKLKAQIMPYDDIEFSRVLDALATRALLVRYASGTRDLGVIPSFTRHQIVNNKEKQSDLPAPGEEIIQAALNKAAATRASRVPHACLTPLNPDQGEGKGTGREREGKGNYLAPDGACGTREGGQVEGRKPKERNLLIDLLVSLSGSDPLQATRPMFSAAGNALAIIREVTPDVSEDEIRRRAANYRLIYPKVALTASALAKWWDVCKTGPQVVQQTCF